MQGSRGARSALPESLRDWLRSVAGRLPPGLTEARCRALVDPPPRETFEPLDDVRRIVVHHSATCEGCVRLFRLMHRGINGWADVGYHYVIGNGTFSGDGAVEEGRPAWARGAHARGSNADTLGICLVGNFEESVPTGRQQRALGRLLDRLLRLNSLEPEDVILHRDVRSCRTVCPGRHLDRPTVLALLDRYQVKET